MVVTKQSFNQIMSTYSDNKNSNCNKKKKGH